MREEKLTELDFYDALRIVAGTKRRLRIGVGDWYSFIIDSYKCTASIGRYGHVPTWPDAEEAKRKQWEVEAEKPKELVVYCACDDDGSSCVCTDRPAYKSKDGDWQRSSFFMQLPDDNLFSKDIVRKYKLVLVDE